MNDYLKNDHIPKNKFKEEADAQVEHLISCVFIYLKRLASCYYDFRHLFLQRFPSK